MLPLTVVGALLATQRHSIPIDWRLATVLIANVLAMSSAFMINDIEDAPSDALDPDKRARNVISDGLLSRETAILVTRITAIIALTLYAISGRSPLFWGSVGLLSAYLYSVEPARLKGYPVIDVVLHSLGGGSLWVMIGYFLYHNRPGEAWPVIIAMASGAAYGQFYNQLDDYEIDKLSGLRNTTIIIGKGPATVLMYGFIGVAAVCLGYAVFSGTFPAWLSTVVVVSAFVCMLFPWKLDMRGNIAKYGALQIPILFTINLTTFLWLAWAIGLMTPGS